VDSTTSNNNNNLDDTNKMDVDISEKNENGGDIKQLISGVDYNKLNVTELKSELKKRNITHAKTAKKSDLIDLLSKKEEA